LSSNVPLSVESVNFSYAKKQILNQVSLTVQPGCFTVLLGANGAGKTTLFSLITRLYSPHKGRIVIYGDDLNKKPEKALSKIGVVFQNQTLDQDLTIRQNLKYYASLYGIPANETDKLLVEQLPKYLAECNPNQKIHQLSGGQKRRVELMRSLMHGPELLVLDEPTVGLDIISRESFLQHVRELCFDNGVGVLWATHLVDEVGDGDQIVMLHDGQVLMDGSVESIMNESKSNDIGEAFMKLTGESPATEAA